MISLMCCNYLPVFASSVLLLGFQSGRREGSVSSACCLWSPLLYCLQQGISDGTLFIVECGQHDAVLLIYTFFSTGAMFVYWLLLIDLTVFSNKISAYILVCSQMFSELALYLLALGIAVLMFASAVSSLDHDNDDFSGIQKGSLTFLLLSLGMVPHRTYEAIVDELVLFFCVCLFIITTAFFLLNLLVAQLTCAYGAMFEDGMLLRCVPG